MRDPHDELILTKKVIIETLKKNSWCRKDAADELDISVSTMYRYIAKYKIEVQTSAYGGGSVPKLDDNQLKELINTRRMFGRNVSFKALGRIYNISDVTARKYCSEAGVE